MKAPWSKLVRLIALSALLGACYQPGESLPLPDKTATAEVIAADPATPSPRPTFSPYDFTVRLSLGEGVDPKWIEEVPVAWRVATLDRSRIRLINERADVNIEVSAAEGRSMTLPGRSIIIYSPRTLRVFVHELGHALGCCEGPGTVDGHFVGVRGIMSDPSCECYIFTEAELEQMGLGSSD